MRYHTPAYTPPGFLPSILSTLTSLTGNSFNFTAAYERVQKEETFDPEADVADGFVRLTGENWEELVSSMRGRLGGDWD